MSKFLEDVRIKKLLYAVINKLDIVPEQQFLFLSKHLQCKTAQRNEHHTFKLFLDVFCF